jgi:hypothetical protein
MCDWHCLFRHTARSATAAGSKGTEGHREREQATGYRLTLGSNTFLARRQKLDSNTDPEGRVPNTLPVELLETAKSNFNSRLQSPETAPLGRNSPTHTWHSTAQTFCSIYVAHTHNEDNMQSTFQQAAGGGIHADHSQTVICMHLHLQRTRTRPTYTYLPQK